MNKVILSLILLSSSTVWANASTFKFNNKNINALMGHICKTVANTPNTNEALVSKILIDRDKYGNAPKQTRIDISGTCNAKVDTKTLKPLNLGDEIMLSFDLANLSIIKGTVGISNIEIIFKSNQLKEIKVSSLISSEVKQTHFNGSSWAQSNTMFSFNNSEKIKIKAGRSISAYEDNQSLILDNNFKFYKLWSYQAYGCYGKEQLSTSKCESILQNISI